MIMTRKKGSEKQIKMKIEKDDRFGKLVWDAYEQIPVYLRNQRLLDGGEEKKYELLEDFPVLERNQLMEEETAVLMPWAEILRLQGKLMYGRTSGSSGKYMEIFWTEVDYRKSMLQLWFYRQKYYGIKPSDRVCYFYTTGYQEEGDRIFRKSELGFSKSNLTMERLCKILEQMNEFQPEWMMLQPSVAMLLCRCMEQYGKKAPDSIRYIEFTGEILTPEVRKITEQHFFGEMAGKTKFCANQYGANEFNSIAYECPKGNLHVLQDNVEVEVLDEKKTACHTGQEGEFYLTTKTNTAMPLIRYRIGDRGCICSETCTCGNKGKILKLSSGRANDWILHEAEDGSIEKITPNVLVHTFDGMNMQMDGVIRQFRVEQEAMERFRITLVLEEEDIFLEEEVKKLFFQNLEDVRLKGAEYKFCWQEELIPEENTGKIRWFISKV